MDGAATATQLTTLEVRVPSSGLLLRPTEGALDRLRIGEVLQVSDAHMAIPNEARTLKEFPAKDDVKRPICTRKRDNAGFVETVDTIRVYREGIIFR